MIVKANSWHARLFHSLEYDESPSVCKYWRYVLFEMPLFYLVMSPISLIVWIAKRMPDEKEEVRKPTRRLCPFGDVTFEREQTAGGQGPDQI